MTGGSWSCVIDRILVRYACKIDPLYKSPYPHLPTSAAHSLIFHTSYPRRFRGSVESVPHPSAHLIIEAINHSAVPVPHHGLSYLAARFNFLFRSTDRRQEQICGV